MGSMFNMGYRGALDGDLEGLSAGIADQAREAPTLALEAAASLGQRGEALTTAALDAFASGMRMSLIFGTGVLAATAAYVWLRGPSAVDEIIEDALDDDLVTDDRVINLAEPVLDPA